ncbi:TetR/AcrR family transcriptional regulator [Gordonia sp. (in: high G+C Gram-positive bacteria)]|uniref:TetR/AcrR family transcriptional regulator n=1 Tax=Gordonia sp. (in: high G+C Gram-positive bacteria) TaxID=84139 RepID=UPI001695C882|nr:TetR/AcrR family transcriptional regulator [Gordonia sp. (in: high G+C Gram-positive bacteria)]NLG47081.1 TetR/AcrR family transcriptional regulator [Gordonia sp. (in: high G+C Gram-positive bacteria)]
MDVPDAGPRPGAAGDKATTRAYRSPLRASQAAETRAAIVAAARDLVITEGFTNTTVRKIADRAGVNIDTVYRSVGKKPEVLRVVIESALSGLPEAVPADQRDYVRRIADASSGREKLEIYAAAITEIQQRLAPIYTALADAARTDEQSSALWEEISRRRAANMRRFAADLRGTGQMRADIDDDTAADLIWSMNGTEYWVLLVEHRGWPPEKFRERLADTWCRLLLAEP